MKETNQMLEIIHNNHDRLITELRIERMIKKDRERIEREKAKKRAVLSTIVLTILLIVCIFGIAKLDERDLKRCIEGGVSEKVCRNSL